MTRPVLKPGRRAAKERTRLPDDAPPFAVGHRIRLESLIILHEGDYSAANIAKMLDEDVRVVTNHLRDLYDAGCIEFVGHEGSGNIRRAVYRAVSRPIISDEEYEAMSLNERHEINGVAVQWILAECLASYRNAKMDRDETLCLITDAPRMAESEEIGTTVVVTLMAFERGRPWLSGGSPRMAISKL
jgi:DNA-binding transcriptional ArsR family regulator